MKSIEKVHWEDILNKIPDWIAVVDREAIILKTNKSGEKVTGLPLKEIIGKKYCEIVHGTKKSLPDCPYQKMLQTGKSQQNELNIPNSDKWFLITADPLRDSKKNIIGGVHIARDISEQKKTERSIKKREEKFRDLFESQMIGMIFWDTKGNISEANDAFLKMVGYTRNEVLSGEVRWRDMTPPEYAHIDNKALEEIATKGTCVPFEKEYIRKDGTRVPILLGASVMKGFKDRGICFVLDITQRKKANEALKKQTHDLGERIKELSCLYRIDNICRDEDQTIEEIIKKIVMTIPPSWQYPEITGSRITFENFKSNTKNFKETRWIQKADIICNGKKSGSVEVCFLKEKPEEYEGPFLKEERNLINAIAERLVIIIESKKEKGLASVKKQISDIFLTAPEEKKYGAVLKVVLDFMKSNNGIFGYIDENGALVCPSMTYEVWDECKMYKKGITFPREAWGGIWGRALTEKKTLYSNKPFRVPKGHIPMHRALDVPIIFKEKVIGNLMIGNKSTDYTENDKIKLEFIVDHIAPILFVRLERDKEERKRLQAEEKLKKYSKNLENIVKKRTENLHKALSETEDSRDKLDGILKSVADGLIVTDTRHRILLMNQAAEDFLDIRLSNVIGRSIDFAIEDKTLRSKIKYTLNKKTTGYQFDFNWPGKDSKNPQILRARTSVIHDKEGSGFGIVTIIHDVSAEREVDRMKTDFLTTAAHELRSPLTSIQGFSEILMTRKDISEDEKSRFLKFVNTQSVALARIVTDLLDVSRIESRNGMALKKVIQDVTETIKKVISYFEGETQIHSIKTKLPKNTVKLPYDNDKVSQIFKNIIGNAIKYSPEGGEIEIALEERKTDCIFSIKDNGIGMTPKQLDKIFNKFYRVDTSDSAPPGTGLGMVIVKHLVESHKGKIWVDSKLGRGTTINFTLPLK